MQRDKQSPLELIKYTGYIQESFGRMRVRGGGAGGGMPLGFYNITICFQTAGGGEDLLRGFFLFVVCVGVKEQLEAALVKT